MLLRAFWSAHKAIVYGVTEETLFTVGTTTMIGGIVMELEKPGNITLHSHHLQKFIDKLQRMANRLCLCLHQLETAKRITLHVKQEDCKRLRKVTERALT